MGSVLPYLPVYLAQRGLSDAQVGYVLSLGGLAVFLTPVLMALLADMRLENRTLLGWVFIASAGALGLLLACQGFWGLLWVYGLFSLAFAPVLSLQDGLTFAQNSRRQDAGLSVTSYHKVRVYGTVGFIAPLVILCGLLAWGAPVQVSLVSGSVFAILALINTRKLPHTRGSLSASAPSAEVPDPHPRMPPSPPALPASSDDSVSPADPGATPTKASTGRGLPTLQAARRMLQPDIALFCAAMWLVHLTAGAYYAFYPIYLKRDIGVSEQWIGPIFAVGVSLEVLYMLGFGRLLKWLGLRQLMAIGVGAVAVRMALLAFVPTLAVAVGTQVLHGLMVLVIHVAPPIYLNHRAEPAYRNSIQALFAMLVFGTGRIAGTLLAGWVAQVSASGVLAVFGWSAVVAGVSALLFAVAFRDRSGSPMSP